jgi:cation diffusion facilitator family transporter
MRSLRPMRVRGRRRTDAGAVAPASDWGVLMSVSCAAPPRCFLCDGERMFVRLSRRPDALAPGAMMRGMRPGHPYSPSFMGGSPRRVALVSVAAAAVLIAVKLGTGIATGSLAFISEAIHSGTDLVAALLALFAVGVAARPADRTHPYGHGKAEHLSALAEGAVLAIVSVWIAVVAIRALLSGGGDVNATWWAIAVALMVMAIDLARTVTLMRAARRFSSAALAGSALHFASDLAGTGAVLVGLVLVRAGVGWADAAAALLVSMLVLAAAARLMRVNVDVLMDRVPVADEAAVRDAVDALGPAVEMRRLRMRSAGGRAFADVVIAVPPGESVGRGHAVADQVEDAIEAAVPGADVVVHVERREGEDEDIAERVLAVAHEVPRVREIHNVRILRLDTGTEASLHLKLPAATALRDAEDVSRDVERAVCGAVPEVTRVHCHVEPLDGPAHVREVAEDVATGRAVRAVITAQCGTSPHEVRLVRTGDGVVAYVTLALGDATLAEAHDVGGRVRRAIRDGVPGVADAFVQSRP